MARALISLLLVGLVQLSLSVGCTNIESAKKEKDVATDAAIPLIDAYPPSITETATFALG